MITEELNEIGIIKRLVRELDKDTSTKMVTKGIRIFVSIYKKV